MIGKTRAFRPCAAALVAAASVSIGTQAAETDQFLLPPRDQFADLGGFFTHVHYRAIEDAVRETNELIHKVRSIENPSQRRSQLARLHEPRLFADRVFRAFGQGFIDTLNVEDALKNQAFRDRYPGKIVAHWTKDWIYNGAHMAIDLRQLPLLFPSSTIQIDGVFLGTDKIGHFHNLGYIYYKQYLNARKGGNNHENAIRQVVHEFSEGVISEGSIIGFLSTGIHSNADLASNYLGMKFFMNLTDPVMLNGREVPPMIVRVGDYWRLNHHVRPESDFFTAFVSDHWNEALNPCIYDGSMQGQITARLEAHAEQIIDFYADEQGDRLSRDGFVHLFDELETYYGEDYGHSGMNDQMVTIASACFDADTGMVLVRGEARPATPRSPASPAGPTRDLAAMAPPGAVTPRRDEPRD